LTPASHALALALAELAKSGIVVAAIDLEPKSYAMLLAEASRWSTSRSENADGLVMAAPYGSVRLRARPFRSGDACRWCEKPLGRNPRCENCGAPK
jgi:hypothetical protein